MDTPLTKNNIAVLTPTQWHAIESQLNADYKIRGDFLLKTAMRIREAYLSVKHPDWFRELNSAIFLPRITEGEDKFGKLRCKQKERAVLLSPAGVKAVKLFYEKSVKLPSYQAMEPAFKRAAKAALINPAPITTKMLRKTYISWLTICRPEIKGMIAASAGHTTDTMDMYYLTYGFRKEDIKEMRDEITGWGEG